MRKIFNLKACITFSFGTVDKSPCISTIHSEIHFHAWSVNKVLYRLYQIKWYLSWSLSTVPLWQDGCFCSVQLCFYCWRGRYVSLLRTHWWRSSLQLLCSKPVQRNCLYFFKIFKKQCALEGFKDSKVCFQSQPNQPFV